MATDINSSASFSFNNMKPAADEECTALWSQNMADNTGFLYYQERLLGNISAQKTINSAFYSDMSTYESNYLVCTKESRHSTVSGTMWARYSSASSAVNGTSAIYCDGTKVLEYANSGITTGTNISSFTWDSSLIAEGNNYLIQVLGPVNLTGSEDIDLNMSASIYSNV